MTTKRPYAPAVSQRRLPPSERSVLSPTSTATASTTSFESTCAATILGSSSPRSAVAIALNSSAGSAARPTSCPMPAAAEGLMKSVRAATKPNRMTAESCARADARPRMAVELFIGLLPTMVPPVVVL